MESVSRDLLMKMSGAIAHRGPDAKGVYQEPGIGLVHNRLAIIDLEGGGQPMTNQDHSLWITFNGEIFNYIELRRRLEQSGRVFSTTSDTEVLLQLYETTGADCVKYLNGQWAFAIWDSRRKCLFLSRDRFGVRPLYYVQSADSFIFGSEIKALFADPSVRRALDPFGLDEVFTFWFPVAPRTAFADVKELPPGHSMTVTRKESKISRHWGVEFHHDRKTDLLESADELLEKLKHAIRIRLRADVPVGAYLSGGLDSTLITALVSSVSTAPLRTFSIGFDDPAFDETAYQSEAVRMLGTQHEHVRCGTADIQKAFPDVIRHAEAPILRTAPAPMFLLSKRVRESGFKVVLTGEGADELFAGYDIFKEAKIRHFWASQPDSVIRPRLLRRIYPWLERVQALPESYLQTFFHPNLNGPCFSHQPRWNLTASVKSFFSSEVRAAIEKRSALESLQCSLPQSFRDWDWLARAQFLETAYLLPGYLLSSQGDRMAMAHAVEGRFPYLDQDVASTALQLPPDLKLKVLTEKVLLRRVAKDRVPDVILNRPKQPYRAPDAAAFRTPAIPDYVEDLFSETQIKDSGIFDSAAVTHLLRKFRSDRCISTRDNMAFVGILSTQLLSHQLVNQRSI